MSTTKATLGFRYSRQDVGLCYVMRMVAVLDEEELLFIIRENMSQILMTMCDCNNVDPLSLEVDLMRCISLLMLMRKLVGGVNEQGEFDNLAKRITPSGVEEGEKEKEVLRVQTALFKEVKVMEEIFDQMNDEVDQNTVDKQCAEIVKKNLLIENENLIANCLSNQLLYDVEKSRCLDLEAEMSKVHNESKHISKLEREYLNLQLKYQHLQESFDNNKSQTSQEAPNFNSFFKIKNLEHQIQEKDNDVRKLSDGGESLKAQELCEKVHQDGNNHVVPFGLWRLLIGDRDSEPVPTLDQLSRNLNYFKADLSSPQLTYCWENLVVHSQHKDVSFAESNQVNQPRIISRKWTKDHPLDNIVGNPSRSVSTRKQLASDALWCCFNYSKLDEYGNVLKNKERLVAKGYRQEEDRFMRERFVSGFEKTGRQDVLNFLEIDWLAGHQRSKEHCHLNNRGGIKCNVGAVTQIPLDEISDKKDYSFLIH
ncbi:hypothetical protein Tco_0592611 [Tanacetum coccineum]